VLVAQGVFIAFCTLTAFAFVLTVEHGSLARARTVAFMVLSCSQLIHAFNCRSEDVSLFRLGVFGNRYLVFAILASFALQFLVVTLPVFHAIFKTSDLTLGRLGRHSGRLLLPPLGHGSRQGVPTNVTNCAGVKTRALPATFFDNDEGCR